MMRHTSDNLNRWRHAVIIWLVESIRPKQVNLTESGQLGSFPPPWEGNDPKKRQELASREGHKTTGAHVFDITCIVDTCSTRFPF